MKLLESKVKKMPRGVKLSLRQAGGLFVINM